MLLNKPPTEFKNLILGNLQNSLRQPYGLPPPSKKGFLNQPSSWMRYKSEFLEIPFLFLFFLPRRLVVEKFVKLYHIADMANVFPGHGRGAAAAFFAGVGDRHVLGIADGF